LIGNLSNTDVCCRYWFQIPEYYIWIWVALVILIVWLLYKHQIRAFIDHLTGASTRQKVDINRNTDLQQIRTYKS
jgi:hypothetical protein